MDRVLVESRAHARGRVRNATEVVEGPRENDWRVYRGRRLMSTYATREEAERSLRNDEDNDIRKYFE